MMIKIVSIVGLWYMSVTYGKEANQIFGCAELFEIPESTTQILIVNGVPSSVSKATMTACEYINGVWINALPTYQAVVGKNGISHVDSNGVNLKSEGDNMTPSGTHSLGEFFGWRPLSDPTVQQFKWDYRYIVDSKDINNKYFDKFVDDVDSPYYNTWITGATDAKSYEQMRITPYKFGLVINWNMYPTVPGKGSAIFMHIWSGPEGSTAGCVALDEKDLVSVLQWLDKAKQPLIKIVAPSTTSK